MKKFLAIALALCMLLSLMPTAFAADAKEVGSAEELAAAAAEGGEVKLTADVILEEKLSVKTDLSINLNGFDITGSVEDDYGLIYIGTAGKLTVSGEGSIANDASYAIGNYGVLTVNGGSFKGAEDYAALYNFYYDGSTYGSAVVSGGVFENDIWNCGILRIKGGEFVCVDNSGEAEISAGTVHDFVARDGADAPGLENCGSLSISGGIFGADPNAYLVDGLKAIQAEDDMWYIHDLYTVSFDLMYGDEKLSEDVVSGECVSEPDIPARPYHVFLGWYMDEALSKKYDFGSPVESDVVLYAKWVEIIIEEEPEEPVEPEKPAIPDCDGGDGCMSGLFEDVDADSWYHAAVEYVVAGGLMKGISDTEFDPDGNMTRAMMWTVLARMAGAETEGGEPWYVYAQQWAVENGVSDGLNPGELVSRQEIVTMLWRSMGRPAARGSLADYDDADEVSQWAVQAMRWAVSQGIIQGTDDGLLDPRGQASRAELAQIFMNCRA